MNLNMDISALLNAFIQACTDPNCFKKTISTSNFFAVFINIMSVCFISLRIAYLVAIFFLTKGTIRGIREENSVVFYQPDGG